MTAPTFADEGFVSQSRETIERVLIEEKTEHRPLLRPTLKEGMIVQYIGHDVRRAVSFADVGVVEVAAGSSDDEFVFVKWKRTGMMQCLSKALVFVNDEAI
jgi:hypothetical protein